MTLREKAQLAAADKLEEVKQRMRVIHEVSAAMRAFEEAGK